MDLRVAWRTSKWTGSVEETLLRTRTTMRVVRVITGKRTTIGPPRRCLGVFMLVVKHMSLEKMTLTCNCVEPC